MPNHVRSLSTAVKFGREIVINVYFLVDNTQKMESPLHGASNTSKQNQSMDVVPVLGFSTESGSLEELIKLALNEFDENGCIVHPPSVTIVLLTMHKWFVTSQELFSKVLEIYHKHRGFINDSSFDDSVFDRSISFSPFVNDYDSSVPILTSILETGEPEEGVEGKDIKNNVESSIPSIVINDSTNGNIEHDGNTKQSGNTEQRSSTSDEKSDDDMIEVVSNQGIYSRINEPTIAGNNNEIPANATSAIGPTFEIAMNEPCIIECALLAEDIPEETLEVKVTCVKEELPEHKSKNDSSNSSDEKQDKISEDVEIQVINVWVICHFLNYWMARFGGDWKVGEKILDDVVLFKKYLINEDQASEKKIKHLIGRSTIGSREVRGNSSRLLRQKEISRTKSLAFKDLSPKDIAEQLTHIDCRSLKKIPMSEWKTYARKSKLSNVPYLEKYVGRFNGLSRWIEAMVLNGETHEIRAHTIEKFLNVAQCLQNHKNFNSLMAVVGALNHAAIRRLHQTMGVLNPNQNKFLQEMTEFLSSEGNYANYRKELGKCDGFYVPILGVHLKDLIAVDTALPDYVSENNEINFQKMVRFYSVIATLLSFKNMEPPAPSKFELINMLRLSIQMTITEDELYELSYAREPRRASCISEISNSDKNDRPDSQMFADWASGRVTSPDTKTIDRHVTSMVEAVFKFYDRDSDGLLTTEDFEAISTNFPFVESFGDVDADRDGVVTKEEMKEYFLKANYRTLGTEFLHKFQETTYLTPNYCDHCGGLLWGIIKQGFKCKDCGINCHKACRGQVVIDCRPKTLSPHSPNLNNSSTLERAANKADTIRNRWKNRRKSRTPSHQHENGTVKNGEGVDEVDSVAIRLEKSDEACKVLLNENRRINDEYERLVKELAQAREKNAILETQMKHVRQETMTFVLEQLDALQLRRNTAV